jgi:tetratricopeptide (TPR) repeat protein
MVEDSNASSTDRNDVSPPTQEGSLEAAALRLRSSGRNEPCPCGSGKKYKKCHLLADEQATAPAREAPTAQELVAKAWGLFEQRRPGAAEREFRAALELDPNLTDAQVGIGMSRLSANDAEGAKAALTAVVTASEDTFTRLAGEGVKDAFTRPEAQPAIRAAHALGCLAYDQERFADATLLLEKVFRIDEGPVGTEARLIAAKALLKQEDAPRAIQILEPALGLETGAGRARLGLALAQFVTGAVEPARANLDEALRANPHFGRALLGRIRRRVDNLAGAQPGSIEEALVYAQTYGDVWTVEAKAFLEHAIDDRAAAKPAPTTAPVTEAPPP